MDIALYLPANFGTMPAPDQARVVQYIESLDALEKRALVIAKEHLGSSFNVVKSNGYINWLKSIDSI